MSDNIFTLASREERLVDENLVARIEELLAEAKSGELQSLSGVAVTDNGFQAISFGTINPMAEIGMLEALKSRILAEFMEDLV